VVIRGYGVIGGFCGAISSLGLGAKHVYKECLAIFYESILPERFCGIADFEERAGSVPDEFSRSAFPAARA